MTKPRIAILGAGHIGGTVAAMLNTTGDYAVTVGDADARRVQNLRESTGLTAQPVDAGNPDAVRNFLKGQDAVISCCPSAFNPLIVRTAAELGVHYFDPTEDQQNARSIQQLAAGAKSLFAPQCGLAPGYISVLAADMYRKFDTLESVSLRVGALPRLPSNRLGYNFTWSPDGLVNEYIYPCDAIIDGKRSSLAPMEGYETLTLDSEPYEAFNTCGGLGTLADSLDGKVRTLTYKTIRYPGHHAYMTFLLDELKLREDKPTLITLLERAIPETEQDVILIYVAVTGMRNGRYLQDTFFNKIYGGMVNGEYLSAIKITTAGGICTVVDLVFTGALPAHGLLCQEDIPLDLYVNNRFGGCYKPRAAQK